MLHKRSLLLSEDLKDEEYSCRSGACSLIVEREFHTHRQGQWGHRINHHRINYWVTKHRLGESSKKGERFLWPGRCAMEEVRAQQSEPVHTIFLGSFFCVWKMLCLHSVFVLLLPPGGHTKTLDLTFLLTVIHKRKWVNDVTQLTFVGDLVLPRKGGGCPVTNTLLSIFALNRGAREWGN